jgi:lipid II:glycine glycyltransferase (peptidoglycan interpeptide bridge formation enzyme)
MDIIELNEEQFRSYSSIHSKRNYLQTVEYANMKKEDGYEPLYLGFINEKDNLLAGTLILSKKLYNKYKYGFAPRGFLIDFSNKELLNTFTVKLKDYLKKKDFIYIRTNPSIRYKVYNKSLVFIDGNANNVNILKSCGYNFMGFKNDFSKYGVHLKVEESLNSIYNNFSRSTKRNIAFGLKAGITVIKGSFDNFELFYELVKKNTSKSMEYYRKLADYFNTDYNKFEIFFAKLNPDVYINNFQYLLKQEQEKNDKLSKRMQNSKDGGSLKLVNKKMFSDRLIEKYRKEIIRATSIYKIFPDGIIIGTCGIIRNNKEIHFLVDGYNEQVNHIHSISLIKWEIMKIYHSVGYREFCFGPIYSKFEDEKYKGLLHSKVGFGGEIIEFPGDFDLVVNKYLYTIYSSFFNLNSKK